MAIKVTITVQSGYWAPQEYLQNAHTNLIENVVRQAIHADIARAYMDMNNKPFLGSPGQIKVTVERKDISQ